MTIKQDFPTTGLTDQQIQRKLNTQMRRNKLQRLAGNDLHQEALAQLGIAKYAKAVSRQRRQTF